MQGKQRMRWKANGSHGFLCSECSRRTFSTSRTTLTITVTGTTIRDNDLKIIKDGIVFESQASLIGKKSLIPETLDSSKDLKKIYTSLLKGAPKEGKLLCRKADKSIFKGITKLSQSGEITDLGFIIESGDYRLDYRFSTLVERQWQENLPMVSEVLFAEWVIILT